ncbi:MAG: transcriptional regulator, partial [Marinobacter sp.]|nr:transcriptional regulator [Marinobacter sp.]
MADDHTPTSRSPKTTASPMNRSTPVDAFQRARQHWLKSERIHLASLAEELGIGRATLFRWVG